MAWHEDPAPGGCRLTGSRPAGSYPVNKPLGGSTVPVSAQSAPWPGKQASSGRLGGWGQAGTLALPARNAVPPGGGSPAICTTALPLQCLLQRPLLLATASRQPAPCPTHIKDLGSNLFTVILSCLVVGSGFSPASCWLPVSAH